MLEGQENALVPLSYQQTMAAAAVAFAPPLQRVLCVGLGAGSLPAFLAHHLPETSLVQAVELDPLVVVLAASMGVAFDRIGSTAELAEVCHGRGFGVLGNDGAPVVAALSQAVAAGRVQPLSALLLDAFDCYGRTPPLLLGSDFLEAAERSLEPGGALIINAFNSSRGSSPRRVLGALVGRLADSFPDGSLFTIPVDPPSNVIVVAVKGKATPRRGALQAASGWPFDAAAAVKGALEVGRLPIVGGFFYEHVPGAPLQMRSSAAATPQTRAEMERIDSKPT